MYEAYWKLTSRPFDNTPDPRFLFPSAHFQEGLGRLLYIIRERKAGGLLTGLYGTGKTLLCHAAAKQLGEAYRFAVLNHPRLDEVGLLKMIVYKLGIQEIPSDKADLLITLDRHLREAAQDGKHVVVVLDEAHSLPRSELFEEIRLLMNFRTEDQFLLTLLLVGQPELKAYVDENKALSQRIAMRYAVGVMSAEETAQYVAHRMQVAGATRPIFSPEACAAIHEWSMGIARKINQISDLALLAGFEQQQPMVTPQMIREAAEGLEGR